MPTTLTCLAIWDHVTFDPNELQFKCGDLIEILDNSDRHWWRGKLHDQEGWFPNAFVHVSTAIGPCFSFAQHRSNYYALKNSLSDPGWSSYYHIGCDGTILENSHCILAAMDAMANSDYDLTKKNHYFKIESYKIEKIQDFKISINGSESSYIGIFLLPGLYTLLQCRH